jgi:ribose transport system ATP-binding protein
VTFSLKAGEILGIAGLIGAGRTETLRVIFGLDDVKGGTVIVGLTATSRASPRERLRQGIGLLSEDRKEEGLMLNRSLADNLTITRFGDVSTLGIINSWKQKRAARDWMEKLQVKAAGPGQECSSLSGGNQQKIAIGRLLHHQATVFLLDEPTRGIDVGSKAQIYRLMSELAGQGKAILFVSSYLPELLGVCDRIGVMCRGVLTDVRAVAEWDEHSIIRAAIGKADEEVIRHE